MFTPLHGGVAARKAESAAKEAEKKLFVEKPSPVAAAKAVKNPAELAGMREAHLRDAVALAETLHHLEQEVTKLSTRCLSLRLHNPFGKYIIAQGV